MQNEKEKDNNKDAVLASTDTEQETEELSTIKATGLQDNISTNNKRDISAIIPKEAIQGEAVEGTLQSKESTLKSDGAIVIGNIENEQIKMTTDAKVPTKIDIEQRKKEQLEALRQKKANPKGEIKDNGDKAKKDQNKSSLIAIFMIIIIGVGFYIYKNTKTDLDFVVKNLTLELGEDIPVHSSDYVIPGIKKAADDMLYSINTSNVIVDEVGTYEYFVTYKNVTKKGTITIQDTKPPEITTRDYTIIEGQGYNAGNFVEKGFDWSGYEYSFEKEDYANYTAPGEYDDIVIVAKDPYENSINKTVKLTIKNKGVAVKYEKHTPIDYDKGYEVTTEYELYFSDYNTTTNILYYANLTEDYKYFDEQNYKADKEKILDNSDYTTNDEILQIIRKSKVDTIGRGLTGKDEIINYLIQEGFTKIQ